ncbi:MAG: DUF465 domain-containing protein [Halofilum sp. (in: g-proteobacteria)]|nr:DUF465 domain-containing protein [Halofilum sp. (in: g-proteobacteria)]
MTHTPHELAAEFPEHSETIHRLKMTDPHFGKLVDEYHAVNREVHRMETEVEPVSSDTEKHVRERRVHLKDQIAEYLERHAG